MTAVDMLKARLRADLKAAMQAKRAGEVKALRMLLGAIDNAEAVPVADQPQGYVSRAFADGSAEVARLALSDDDLQALIAGEISSRLAAADELAQLGVVERAEMLAAEAEIVARYRR